MPTTMNDILHPGGSERDASFPYAPQGWSKADAKAAGKELSLDLADDHWEVVRVLHGCYSDEPAPRLRLIADALNARFHDKGGLAYLYELFPGGPIAQGCRLAGLQVPSGSLDAAQGNVV